MVAAAAFYGLTIQLQFSICLEAAVHDTLCMTIVLLFDIHAHAKAQCFVSKPTMRSKAAFRHIALVLQYVLQ